MARTLLAGLLFLWAGVGSFTVARLPNLNPTDLRGLIPLESPEVSLARFPGGVAAAFTGLRGRDWAVHARIYDDQAGKWNDAVRLSPASAESDRRPFLIAAPSGALHCAWLSETTLPGDFAVLYSRLDPGSAQWTEPVRVSGGHRKTSPRLAVDVEGRIFLYYDAVTAEQRWGRLFVWASADGGRTWEESNPNFAAAVKKGGTSDPILETGEDGRVRLVWLDPTPGGRSVVFNASNDGGKTWLDGPVAVNADKRFALANPRLVSQGKRVYVFWTKSVLESRGRKTEFWTDASEDGGMSWKGNRMFHSAEVSEVTLEVYKLGDDVGSAWIGRGRDSGVLGGGTVWRSGQPVEDAARTRLREEPNSYFNRLQAVSGEGSVAMFYSTQDAFDAGRVEVFVVPSGSDAWEKLDLAEPQPLVRGAAPVAIFDPVGRAFSFVFHEAKKRQFLGAPEAWETSLIFGQLKFESHSGDEG